MGAVAMNAGATMPPAAAAAAAASASASVLAVGPGVGVAAGPGPGAAGRIDRVVPASGDIAGIDLRITPATGGGAPKLVVLAEAGTLGKPEFNDIIADRFAAHGIETWAIGPLADSSRFGDHAARVERIAELARAERPGTPMGVVGSSLGAMAVLDWRARHGSGGVPMVAFNPVFLERMLPFGDRAKVAGSLVSHSIGSKPVNTPMTLGIALTDNPASLEYSFDHAQQLTVPARIFGDVAKLGGNAIVHGRGDAKGALAIAMAGDDHVALNLATRGAAKLMGVPKSQLWKVAGAPHDLTQLADPALFDRVANFLLTHAHV